MVRRALSSARNVDMGFCAISRTYCVTKTTLKRHFEGKNYCGVEGQNVGTLSDLVPKGEE
jgi:hypothetical protein